VAIDVGSGDSGSCAWPLLSEGHVVHMREPKNVVGIYLPGFLCEFIQLTLDINGWKRRGFLHGAVQANEYVKDVFESIDNIHLLKIDVDDRESYEAVFAGVGPILHKTEIVQIEMLAEEIDKAGMVWIMETLMSYDFLMFGLEDVDTFPGFQHDSLGRRCVKGDLRSRMHSKA
ncbi:unnamed protein product, partial [Symbiodinium pilosum]